MHVNLKVRAESGMLRGCDCQRWRNRDSQESQEEGGDKALALKISTATL